MLVEVLPPFGVSSPRSVSARACREVTPSPRRQPSAVDGLGLLIAAMTVYDLWQPVEALADALLAWCGS
jgi:hypothetical protein